MIAIPRLLGGSSSKRVITAPLFKQLSTTSPKLGEIFNVQDDNDFVKKVVENKDVVIVDFYADWCGPCRLLAPKLEIKIASEKTVHLAKVNVDNLDELAARHQVKTIPHVVAYKGGKPLDKFIGNKDDDEIQDFIERAKN